MASPDETGDAGPTRSSRRLALAGILGLALIGGVVAVVLASSKHTPATAVAGGVLGASTTAAAGTPEATSPPAATAAPITAPTATPLPAAPTATAAPQGTGTGTGTGTGSGSGSGSGQSAPAAPRACAALTTTRQTVSIPQAAYRPGQGVVVTVQITNTGVTCPGAPTSAAITVTDPQGHIAGGADGATGSGQWVAGSTVTETFIWNGAGTEGQYTVSASWNSFPGTSTIHFTENSACTAADFSLQIYSETGHAAATAVPTHTTVTNTSGHACTLAYAVKVVVTDAGGNVVAGSGAGSASTSGTWSAGQSFTDKFDWKPSAAGTYTVTATDTEHGLTTKVTVTVN